VLKLDLTKDAGEFLVEREAKQSRQIWNKIIGLMKDPFPNDSAAVKGYPGYFRANIGEFRIIYKADKECLWVLIIDKRNDDEVYKRLKHSS